MKAKTERIFVRVKASDKQAAMREAEATATTLSEEINALVKRMARKWERRQD